MRDVRTALLVILAGCSFSPNAGTDGGGGRDTPAASDGSAGAPDGSAGAGSGWWNTSWLLRRPITIDNSQVAEALPAFPVLVTLTPETYDYASARTDGGDLRFVADDQATELPHDLDTFVEGGRSPVWVAVDVPDRTHPPPTIWVYYDNASAATDGTAAVVWADDVGVYHLDQLADATRTGHDAAAMTANGQTTPAPVAGLVGGARSFNGNADALTLGSSDGSDFAFTTAMSVTLWLHAPAFSTNTAANYECFVCKGDKTWRVQRDDLGSAADWGTTHATISANLGGSRAVDDNNWHHVAVVLASGTKVLYVDGVLEGSDGSASAIDVGSAVPVVLGENDNALEKRNLDGLLDEVRISGSTRSAAWVLAEHDTVVKGGWTMIGSAQTMR